MRECAQPSQIDVCPIAVVYIIEVASHGRIIVDDSAFNDWLAGSVALKASEVVAAKSGEIERTIELEFVVPR